MARRINPTGSSIDGSGRLFITTLGGVIRVVDAGFDSDALLEYTATRPRV
jgi:hypothetical protein